MTTVSYTTEQKSSLIELSKKWNKNMVTTIMRDEFDADEDSFRALFNSVLNSSTLFPDIITHKQKNIITKKFKKWIDKLLVNIMSDDFEADEYSFLNLFNKTINFSELKVSQNTKPETFTLNYSNTEQGKVLTNFIVSSIMSDNFNANEDSFRKILQDTLTISLSNQIQQWTDLIVSTIINKDFKHNEDNYRTLIHNSLNFDIQFNNKKPISPYLLFLWGDRTDRALLGHGIVNTFKDESPQLTHKEAVKKAAAYWRSMTDLQKSPYIIRSDQLKNRNNKSNIN